MTSLDKIAGPLAAKLIRQFGTNVTYTAMSDSCPPVETVFTLKGIIESYSTRDIGATIQNGNAKVTISGADWAARAYGRQPRGNDLVAVGDGSFIVVGVTVIYSGASAAAYELQVK